VKVYQGLSHAELLRLWRWEEHRRAINSPTVLFHNNPRLDQAEAFQFRADDGSETTATFLGTVNSNQTLDSDTNHRIRFEVGELDGGALNNVTFTLEYDAGGGFASVGSTTPLQYATSPNYTAAGDTTQQIGNGTYISTNACLVDGAAANDGSVDFSGNDNVEVEFCFRIDSSQVANNDTIALRIVANGGSGNIRSQTATLTVNKPAVAQGLSPSALTTATAFGAASVTAGAIGLAVGGLPSGHSFGAPSLVAGYSLLPSGRAGATVWGAAAIATGAAALQPSGLAGGAVFGAAAVVPGAAGLQGSGILSANAFGLPVLLPQGVLLFPDGLASALQAGAPIVALPQPHVLAPPWRRSTPGGVHDSPAVPAETRMAALAADERRTALAAESRTTATRSS